MGFLDAGNNMAVLSPSVLVIPLLNQNTVNQDIYVQSN